MKQLILLQIMLMIIILNLFCYFQHFNKLKKGSGLWKFNNSLVSNEDFIQKYTEYIQNVKEQLNPQTQFCDRTKWEILKYEIRLF